ncbi:hypothetical protein LPB72_12240 [Hydrogenophaga crassostreae]|uniref:Metallo-beta-lactamase domain-containing protein n=1 Tax=Hydrogenophaga crassostreae TaxID=1763535 RepID=A0ABX2U7W3_9BURK|nr:hypothetical protein LPB72_12240 [Hydrogenophaga crassostreae]
MAGCVASPAQTDCRAQAGVEPVPWEPLAPGVWVWPGAVAEVGVGNRGHVAPTTVVLDGGEAAVIDPGPSLLHGLRVRRSVVCRFQARVRWVVNTHAHAENVLANGAFDELVRGGQAAIVSTSATLAAMRERCSNCLASLKRKAGEAAMAGTNIRWPDRVLNSGDVLQVGRLALQVMPIEQGHTEGDLVLWNARLRIVWAGGLAYMGRIPELSQGSVEGWLLALNHLDQLKPLHVVSAVVSSSQERGSLPEALIETRAYLTALRQGVLQAMDEGHQPQEAGQVPMPAYAHWAGYAERHAFNVQRAWRELEPVWMDRGN